MPIEAVKIPQNVYIEDRIIGPITLRQIIIMAVTGGVSYVMYTNVARIYGGNPGIVLTIACFFPFMIGVAFSFVRVNDLSLMRICFLMLERMNKPNVRKWEPRKGITVTISVGSLQNAENNRTAKKLAEQQEVEEHTQKRIQQLSSYVDTVDPVRTDSAQAPLDGLEVTKNTNAEPVKILPSQEGPFRDILPPTDERHS